MFLNSLSGRAVFGLTRHRVILLSLTGLVAVAIACGSDSTSAAPSQPTQTPPGASNTATPNAPAAPTEAPAVEATLSPEELVTPTRDPIDGPPPPPPVNINIRSVPLEDVIFDTFDGGAMRLSEATPLLIDRLFNAIKPIYLPRYEDVEQGSWLAPGDLILGYTGVDQAFAYPIKFLNFHEIVNDEIDGIPLLVTYCPLCASGVVYDRRVGDRTLTFGNTSALYQSDLVMVDHETGSYWFQTGGEAVIGELTETRLRPLPSVMMQWSQWTALHPDTKVLSREQGFAARRGRYDNDPFVGFERSIEQGRFPFPVDEERIGSQLGPSEIVVTIRVDDVEKAYPLGRLGDAAINDSINGEPVLLIVNEQGPVGIAFSRRVGDRVLTFSGGGSQVTDDETGTTWDGRGIAVAGELEGERLELLPMRRGFWFSISIAEEGIEVFSESG